MEYLFLLNIYFIKYRVYVVYCYGINFDVFYNIIKFIFDIRVFVL